MFPLRTCWSRSSWMCMCNWITRFTGELVYSRLASVLWLQYKERTLWPFCIAMFCVTIASDFMFPVVAGSCAIERQAIVCTSWIPLILAKDYMIHLCRCCMRNIHIMGYSHIWNLIWFTLAIPFSLFQWLMKFDKPWLLRPFILASTSRA